MSGVRLPLDVIRDIFSYGDVNDIPKREMVFNQLLFLKKEFIFYKNECYRGHRRLCRNKPFYKFILKKNRLKMLMWY
tara:strand:- start:306 stop:536 length:231 start_codon:yes stop_codon:yes gene_type:complete